MKRRDFLKSCGLAAVAPVALLQQPDLYEEQRKKVVEMFTPNNGVELVDRLTPKADDIDGLNGTVWKADWPLCHKVVVLFVDVSGNGEGEAVYALLSRPYKACGGGTAMMICHYETEHGLYTESELRKKFSSKWKRCPELQLRLWNEKEERTDRI